MFNYYFFLFRNKSSNVCFNTADPYKLTSKILFVLDLIRIFMAYNIYWSKLR